MFKLIFFLVFFIFHASAFPDNGISYNKETKSVSNWKSQATEHLLVSKNYLQNHKYKRCIKLNNYWCLKDVGWNGGIGNDTDNHTAFRHGYYAARAAVRNFRTAYVRHNRKTALSIMNVYAPVTDCIGSEAARRADGTCIHGNNDSISYAKSVSKGISEDIYEDLKLFDSNGRATESLIKFLQNISAFEIGGLKVSVTTIKRGICMENSTCSSP